MTEERYSISREVGVAAAVKLTGIPARTLRDACKRGEIIYRRTGPRYLLLNLHSLRHWARNRPKRGPKGPRSVPIPPLPPE